MNYGGEFRTDQGDVIIDGVRKHPVLYYEHTLVASSPNSWGISHLNLNFPPTKDLVFVVVHPIDGFAMIQGLNQDGNGNFTGAVIGCQALFPPPFKPVTVHCRVYNVTGMSGVKLPGNYGLQLFGPNGEEIFNTLRPTLRVHKFGAVTITTGQGGVPIPVDVNFDPVEEMPWFFVGNPGLFLEVHHPNATTVEFPMCGLPEKDGSGRYYQFTISPRDLLVAPPEATFWGSTSYPWTVPYVVFV